MNPFSITPAPASASPEEPAQPAASSDSTAPAESQGSTAAPAVEAPAVAKFRSCRWRAAPEDGEFCTHRDVLPFAGKNDFKAESWCPECAFYKLRRTPKKREWVDRNAY